MASKGAWFAGTFFILKRYINDPVTLASLFASVVLPSGVMIKYLCEGSIICVLEATHLPGLQELWLNYQSGKLLEALEEVLITEELKALADGQEITMSVTLDENIYREVCLELMVVKQKGKVPAQGVNEIKEEWDKGIINRKKVVETSILEVSQN